MRTSPTAHAAEISHAEAFVAHLLAMPDTGEDADFEPDPSPPREVEL